jgi:hypothetical protein
MDEPPYTLKDKHDNFNMPKQQRKPTPNSHRLNLWPLSRSLAKSCIAVVERKKRISKKFGTHLCPSAPIVFPSSSVARQSNFLKHPPISSHPGANLHEYLFSVKGLLSILLEWALQARARCVLQEECITEARPSGHQYTAHNANYTAHNANYTAHRNTIHSIQFTTYCTVHGMQHTVHCILYTSHRIQCREYRI